MVNPEMFKDAFVFPQKSAVAPQPVVQPQPQQYDPETEKIRKLLLKWLSIAIGGGALLLIVWRIILKFI